jgi:hypothetical protein
VRFLDKHAVRSVCDVDTAICDADTAIASQRTAFTAAPARKVDARLLVLGSGVQGRAFVAALRPEQDRNLTSPTPANTSSSIPNRQRGRTAVRSWPPARRSRRRSRQSSNSAMS